MTSLQLKNFYCAIRVSNYVPTTNATHILDLAAAAAATLCCLAGTGMFLGIFIVVTPTVFVVATCAGAGATVVVVDLAPDILVDLILTIP